MGESQKVERARFWRQFTLRTGLSRTPERHQPRLLRVETQAIFLKPLEEDSPDLLRITLMREAQHQVSRAGESHPCALSELDVNLSAHTAPVMEP